MNKRPLLFSSIIAMIFTTLYVKISYVFILNKVQLKFPNELGRVDSNIFLNDADNYLWELQKMQFLFFAICVLVIFLSLTFLLWKKGRDFKSTGFYFFAFSLFTLLNGFFYLGFKGYSLFLLIVFAILFTVGLIKKRERLTFIAGLFIVCSIVINLYCYFIGFTTIINH